MIKLSGKKRLFPIDVDLAFDPHVLNFSIKFTEESYYVLDKPVDPPAIQKLYGIAFNSLHPHKNSVRFGWHPSKEGFISIYAYIYKDGVRSSVYLLDIPLYEATYFKIIIKETKWFMYINDVFYYSYDTGKDISFGWLLRPYVENVGKVSLLSNYGRLKGYNSAFKMFVEKNNIILSLIYASLVMVLSAVAVEYVGVTVGVLLFVILTLPISLIGFYKIYRMIVHLIKS